MKDASDVEIFEKLELQVHSTRHEIAELSKKKPNDALNTFKLGHLNSLLLKCNSLLGADVALDGFTSFGEDQVPTNSDAVFVLAHYTDALHRFRLANTTYFDNKFHWLVSKSKEKLPAPNPAYRKYKD